MKQNNMFSSKEPITLKNGDKWYKDEEDGSTTEYIYENGEWKFISNFRKGL